MNQRMRISFREPEVAALAELSVEEAPTASKLLWALLQTPFTGRAVHAIYAGPAILIAITGLNSASLQEDSAIEAEATHPQPGDLFLLPSDADEEGLSETSDAIGMTLAIFYGNHGRLPSTTGGSRCIRLGHITQGMEQLREACRAVRFDGAREVSLARDKGTNAVNEATLYTDGASLGNPGPAGAGFVLTAGDGRLLAEGSIPLDATTVNVAEYRALLAGLGEALRLGVQRLELRMDSELVIRQLCGQYRVKARPLVPLFIEAKRLIGRFESFNCRHVPREQNQRADELAGIAAKRAKAAGQ